MFGAGAPVDASDGPDTGMNAWSRRVRRVRFALSAAFAAVVIGLAVLVGISQLVMPWLVHNPDRVESWLAGKLGRPVAIGAIRSDWVAGGPRLVLEGVRIGAGGGATEFAVPRAELAFNLFAPLQRNRAWNEFRVSGLDLAVRRGSDGRWQVSGLVFSGGDPVSMGALGALVLRDVKLRVDDPGRDLRFDLRIAELRLLNREGDMLRLLGRVSAARGGADALDLIADFDSVRRSGKLYVSGRDVDLAGWPAGRALFGILPIAGRGTVQLWASLDRGRIVGARARVELADTTLASSATVAAAADLAIAPRVHFDRLAFAGGWRTTAGGWQLDLADIDAGSGSDADATGRFSLACDGSDPARCRAGAAQLPIAPIANLAMLSDEPANAVRDWLYLAAPRGVVERAQWIARSADDYDLEADFANLQIAPAGKLPGLELARARLDGDDGALLVELPEQPLRIHYPHVFRKPFVFARLGGDLVAWRDGAGWRVATDRIAFQGEGYGGEVRGGLHWQNDGTRPSLDLAAAVGDADVTAAKLFWPVNIMPPPVVEWLDHALVEGHVSEGRAIVRGDLDQWPFHDHSGRFEASCEVDATTFAFHPEWPSARQVRASADFVGVGLEVEVDAAQMAGNSVRHASAKIADLAHAVLDLQARADGSAAHLLDFLRATPIGSRHEAALAELSLGGTGEVELDLHLPIAHEADAVLALDGKVALADASLDIAAEDLRLDGIGGTASFDEGGFATGPLTAAWDGRPATLAVAVGEHVADPAHAVEARLELRAPASALFARIPQVAPALARFPGQSDWRIDLGIDDRADPSAAGKHLTLRSDLVGTAIDLPVPLGKPAGDARSFRLELELPYAGRPFSARLGDLVAVRGRLPGPAVPFAARADFGASEAGKPPPAGLFIGGRVATVAAGDWLAFAGEMGGTGGGLLRGIDLVIDDTAFGEYAMGANHLRVAMDAAATEIRVDGEALAGRIVVPEAARATDGIRGDFERIHLPVASGEPDSGSDAEAEASISPLGLPPLHFRVADFRLGEAMFGEARFDATPIPGGMRIDRLEADSADIGIEASGTWTGSAAGSRTKLGIDLTSRDLGRMMDALGFAGLIDGGATAAHFDAEWPGSPSAFGFAKLSGTLGIQVDEGRILEVEPGAGRIFGLLSLREIPRRLSLDFSDFFRSGMSFNSINGHFRFEDGNAWTDDLAISGPAADIEISGRTGLAARDYDQEMVVTPHAGATLPLVGAVAGGPVGAAAGLVMQGLLSKQIGRATRSHYHVGGTWEHPDIDLIAKDKPDAPDAASGKG